LRLNIFIFCILFHFYHFLFFLEGRALASGPPLQVYGRSTYKHDTPVADFQPQRLDFGDVINMAANDEDNRLLKDFTAPCAGEVNMGYNVPDVQTNDFELKQALTNMVSQNQFASISHEDPN
jgi:hypothetical protein